MYTVIEHLWYLHYPRADFGEIDNVLDYYFSDFFVPNSAIYTSTKIKDKLTFVFDPGLSEPNVIRVSRTDDGIHLKSPTFCEKKLEEFREILLSEYPLA